MALEVRILGNQPEPTMLQKGLELYDMQYRTKDAEAFEQGKILVENYINAHFDGDLPEDQYYVCDDPMQITLGEYEDTGKFSLNSLARQLEKLGFFGKSGSFREYSVRPEFARDFNRAVSSEENILEDGSVNWDFVDADLYASENRPNSDAEYYNLYESIAIQYELSNGIIQ